MAATDHTRLRTARPSADTKSTDTSRLLPTGMVIPPGADSACDTETTPSEALHGSTDTQCVDGGVSTPTELRPGIPANASRARARIRHRVERVCDYLELGACLAAVASRTASASIYADDQALAGNLADLGDLIDEEIAYLRRAAGIDLAPSTAQPRTLDLPLGIDGMVVQRASGAAMPPESPA